MFRFLLVFCLLGVTLPVFSLDSAPGPADFSNPSDSSNPADFDGGARGDSAMAARYAQWAKDAVDQGRWSEAIAGLERASDFAGVSSDISYLLALARSHESKGRRLVLEALNRSIAVNRWTLYDSDAARLMKAENLICMRAYPEALAELSPLSKSPQEAVLTLRAFEFFKPDEFLRFMADTLDRFPRETGPVRVFFDYLRNKNAGGLKAAKEDPALLELILRRLPVLLPKDPELAWMAAPFMRDSDEAKRLVEAYRAVHTPVPASLPAALRLGVIDEKTAMEELFAPPVDKTGPVLDVALLTELWNLLRTEEARAVFRRNLSAYTGVFIEDADKDGIPEVSVEYSGGLLTQYNYDADQDGCPELTVFFEAGVPTRASALIPPDVSAGQRADIQWERYPAILNVELAGVRYIPRPIDFHYSPITFEDFCGSGLLFPRREPLSPPLTRRLLVFSVHLIERPSREFKGGIEIVELARGIPVLAREYVGGLKVSETEFLRGRPQLQRLDLNLDGRMDTVRRFKRNYKPVELENLWDYDRDIDTVSTWDGEYGE